MDFYLTDRKGKSSRSKIINLKLQVSLVSSVDGTLGATSVSVEGVLWITGAWVLWRALYDAFP